VGPDSALWFTESAGNKIGRITTGGTITEFAIPTANVSPQGIAAGPDGALWFTEQNGGNIGRITTAGAITEFPIPTANQCSLYLDCTYGIAAGPDGALWFTEFGVGKIGRITTAGAITEFAIQGDAPTPSPFGIAAGPDGALWFTEQNGGKIGRITTAGAITEYAIPGPLVFPWGIAAGPDGALWFTFTNSNQVASIGGIGRISTSGAITEYPLSLAFQAGGITTAPDGALWFADSNANGIGRITTAGAITEFAIPTANQCLGDCTYGITAGPDGALWFTEFSVNKIERAMVTTGAITVTTSPGPLTFPLTFTVDGTSYTGSVSFNWSAGEKHTIGVVTTPQYGVFGARYAFTGWSDGGGQTHTITAGATSSYTASFATQYQLITVGEPPGAGTISVSPLSRDGFYGAGASVQLTARPNSGFQFFNWSSDAAGNANPLFLAMVAPYTVQANFIGPSTTVSTSEYPAPSFLASPPVFPRVFGIAAGPDGALWFTEENIKKIGRITTTGVITEYQAPAGPSFITAGPDGALWFSELGTDGIGRVSTTGAITEYPFAGIGGGASGITAGPDGALWFTYAVDKIGRMTTTGVVTAYKIPNTQAGAGAITAGPDGALWFTESSSGAIGRITTDGAITEYQIPGGVSQGHPSGIAAGPDGALWFTQLLIPAASGKIGRITTSGVITEYPTPGSPQPYGITVGPDGALWFTDLSAPVIGRITTAGMATTYSSGNNGGVEITIGPDGALWFPGNGGTNVVRVGLPTSTVCTYSLPQGSQAFSSGSGNATAAVRAAGTCTWTASSAVPWVTITDGISGAGNGTVRYTVAPNPTGATRTGVLTITNQPYTVTQAGTTTTANCAATVPSAPQVAIEGRTERLGDYVLSCTGLSGSVKADFTLALITNVTNALSNGSTDAVLTVNGGGAQNGVVAGYSSIRWPGVVLTPAGGGTASVRISGVRADASLLLTQGIAFNAGSAQAAAITGQVRVTGVPVSNAVQVMANAVQTMVFTEQAANPATGGPQTTIPMVFQEAQAGSFTAGVTRLYLSLSSVPSTVQVYAPVFPNEGARAQLYSADGNGVGGSPVAGSPFAGGMYQLLPANAGTVTATWVVLAADAGVIDTYTFPLIVVNAASGDLSQMQVAGSLAPVSVVSIPSATAPVPRYRNLSVQPQLTNLRVSTSVAVAGTAGLVKGNARTQAGPVTGQEMPVPLGTAGSNLTFTTQVVNDTSDPNQAATNVVIRDNLPTGLNLISCTVAGGVNCSGTDANIGTLAPGQGTTVTVVAAVDPSYTGTVVENPVSATSDDATSNEVNLDLLASTSSSSFILGGVPVTVAADPAAGGGAAHNFTFQFSDPAGYQNLSVVNVLINSVLDGRNACYLAYEVQANKLDLVDDAGDAGGPYAGSVALGSTSTIQNSQCAVGLVSALGSGATLTLTLSITFNAGFGGNKVAFVAARDTGAGNTDWQALGVWQVPSGTPPAGSIAGMGVTPARDAGPSGTNQQFTFTLTDSNGTGDFGVVNVLINKFIDGRQACYLAFVASTETLVLVDDSGDAGGPWAGSMVLNGRSEAIGNSQCSVSGTGSAVAYSPGAMTLTLNIPFQGGFGGNRVFYVAGRDGAGGNNTGWQAVGTWTVE